MRRRRAVLAGHDGDREGAGRLAADPDPTVRAAALGALWRLGALDDDILLRALGDPDPGVRRRACAVAGGGADDVSPSPAVVDGLVQAADDTDPSVVETAAWALGEVGPRCGTAAVARLCRVAGRPPFSGVSRIGRRRPRAPSGRRIPWRRAGRPRRHAQHPAAGGHRPGRLRRSDAPMTVCGAVWDDRDWQVRQAAEELLADD